MSALSFDKPADERRAAAIRNFTLGLWPYALLVVTAVLFWRGGTMPSRVFEIWATALVLVNATFYVAIRFVDPDRLPSWAKTFGQLAFSYAISAVLLPFADRHFYLLLLIAHLPISFAMLVLTERDLKQLCVLYLALLAFGAGALMLRGGDNPSPGTVATVLVFNAVSMVWLTLMGRRIVRLRNQIAASREQIRHLATRDALTGLANRSAVLDRLGRLHERSTRGSRAAPGFGVCLFDLDHFKQVNDRHGHAMGDRVLQRFAQAATSVIRDTDTFGRIGGEEFLLVLDTGSIEQVRQTAERVRHAVATIGFEDLAAGLQVTVSAGCAAHRSGEPVERLIERADRMLYQAKHAGRDRVVAEPGFSPDDPRMAQSA